MEQNGAATLTSLSMLTNLGRPHQLLELAAKAVQAAHGALGLVSHEGEFQEHLTFGMDPAADLDSPHASWSRALIQLILKRPAPINLADFGRDFPVQEGSLSLAAQPPLATGPFLGVPLVCHGRCRGALYVARSPQQQPFREQDLETLLPVCTWLGQGNLFEEARLLGQLRLLNRVAQAAAGSLDLRAILDLALRELDRHLPQYTCVVWLLEDPKPPGADGGPRQKPHPPGSGSPSLILNPYGMVANERATKLGLSPGLRLTLDEARFSACLRNGQAHYVDLGKPLEPGGGWSVDPATHHPPPTSHHDSSLGAFELLLGQRGARSSFAVALRAGDQVVGILQSICTRASGFTSEQIQLLYLVADLLGPAISNCQHVHQLRAAYQELYATHDQLLQAEKMRAVGELAGGMAHDFNNSLCGVLGFLELALADKGLEPTIAGYLESARTCTLDASQTVRRVQTFARWQRNELSIQLVDFNQLVRETLELTRHKWESLDHALGSPITVHLQTEATESVLGSPAELREVVTNLIFNAVDAMPHGGELRVRTWSNSGNVFLSVGDTGTGMTESTRRRLFEPFFTTKGERGTGLGLSVTFGIVQRYEGEITVDSELGRGSTFTVRLPLPGRPPPQEDKGTGTGSCVSRIIAGANPAGRSQQLNNAEGAHHSCSDPSKSVPRAELHPTSASAEPSSSGPKNLRILVIEDEESIRRFLAKALTQLGHSPRTAADATEGLAAFSEERFDLVFTDLGLPGMSGEEVARTIAGRSPATPVILLTGWSHQLKDEARTLAGVTHILGKPVTLNTLSAALAAVCRG
jgi:signal transduction histidine kinase/CheY-like chemotaxis protein